MLHVERLPAVEVDGVEGASAAWIEAGDEHDAFAGVGLEDAAGEGFHFVGRAYAGLVDGEDDESGAHALFCKRAFGIH